MQFKSLLKLLLLISVLSFLPALVQADVKTTSHVPKHFPNIIVVVFENFRYPDLMKAPAFKKLFDYASSSSRDEQGNGYAFFSTYYNNHNGGTDPTRPSQPNYIALTSGSTQGIADNNNHNIDADNLALELEDAGISWKVYAEDLPDSGTNGCFTGASNIEGKKGADDGYKRKHEPFISYVAVQNNPELCHKIVNSKHLVEDLNQGQMADVNFYIPNQINDGHNGLFNDRVKHANAFLASMIGADLNAPLQKFMAQGGLVVLTMDEPSVVINSDMAIYTLLAGNMINSGVNKPTCYPEIKDQKSYPKDKKGDYKPDHCNHYNLLKLIETNWGLRGLNDQKTASGYKYAFPLDNTIPMLWMNSDKKM